MNWIIIIGVWILFCAFVFAFIYGAGKSNKAYDVKCLCSWGIENTALSK